MTEKVNNPQHFDYKNTQLFTRDKIMTEKVEQDAVELLLPCPFCGNIPELITRGNNYSKKRSAEVYCKPCHLITTVGVIRFPLQWAVDKVTERWNTRHYNNPIRALRNYVNK